MVKHLPSKQNSASSSLVSRSNFLTPWLHRAPVAQWIERSPAKAEAVGPIPIGRAIFFRAQLNT